jgi:hypothetical protein
VVDASAVDAVIMNAFRDPPTADTITYRCPVCGATANLISACPGCGRAPDPRASRLSSLDASLVELAGEVLRSRAVFERGLATWQSAQATRDALVSSILASQSAPIEPSLADRAASIAPDVVPPIETGTGDSVPYPQRPAPLGHPDASPRTVQNLLFVLGAVLLGIAAIVFTAVAWTSYGVGGRAAILGGATIIAFAIPLVAVRRRLTATAETFTAIALLLLTLDGYGLWALNVAGAADGLAGTTYAGGVAAVVAVVAAGFGRVVRLTGPRFVAIIGAQPALPLLLASHRTSVSAAAVCFAAIASADIGIIVWRRRVDHAGPAQRAERVLTWAFALVALAIATAFAGGSLANAIHTGPVLGASGAVALAAVVLAWTGWFARPEYLRIAAVAGAVVEIGLAAFRVGIVATPAYPLIVAAVVTLAVAGSSRAVPQHWWPSRGVTIGAYVATAVLAAATLVPLAANVLTRATGLDTLWHANLSALIEPVDARGHTLAVLALVAAIVVVPAPRRYHAIAGVFGVAAVALSAGMIAGAPWWAMLLADGCAVAVLLGVAVPTLRHRHDTVASAATAAAALLALHASWFGLARPVSTVAVQGGLIVAATVMTFGCRGIGNRRIVRIVRGVSVAIALLVLPGFAAATADSGGASSLVSLRSAYAAVVVAVVALLAVRRRTHLRWYAVPAVSAPAMVVGFTSLAVVGGDSAPIYVLVSLLLIVVSPAVAGLRGRSGLFAAGAGAPLAFVAAASLLPVLADVFVRPYAWLGRVWSGTPSGVGLAPSSPSLSTYDLGVIVLAAAVAIVVGMVAGGRRMAMRCALQTAIPMLVTLLVVVRAPWPTVPMVLFMAGALATGLAGIARRGGGWEPGVVGVVALGAGAAGLAPTKTSSLCALGGLVVLASIVAVTGRTVFRRAAAWTAAVIVGDWLAFAAARAAGTSLGATSYGIVFVAATALFLGAWLESRSRPVDSQMAPTRVRLESAALVATAHASALVAFVLCGSTDRGAVVAAAWGAVVGVRALWPGLPSGPRRINAAAAAGLELIAWWLVAAAHGVHVIEAYTLPLAAVALFGGWLAARSRPLGSWIAYGPALLAAFLPSLAPALALDASVARRVVVGAVALAVVLIGAHGRLQAPVIIGGGTLVLLPLPELVFLWRVLPTWMPLTLAGLVLLACAITYERRRRDLARLRTMIGRMT